MEIVNLTDILTTDFVGNRNGQFIAIVKTKLGIVTTNNKGWESPIDVFRNYSPNSLLSIEFTSKDSNDSIIIFARNGNKIMIADISLLSELRVGDVLSWKNTCLYNKTQLQKVNAKGLSDYVFINNIKVNSLH